MIPEDPSGSPANAPVNPAGYPVLYAPLPPVPPPAPAHKHTILKVILSVLGVLLLGFVGLVVWGAHIVKQQQLAQGTGKAGATVPTAAAPALGSTAPAASTGTIPPLGSASAPANAPAPPGTVTPQDLGIPIYPGATLYPGSLQKSVTADATVVEADYATPDAPSVVTQFYQARFQNGVTVINTGPQTMLNIGSGNDTVTVLMSASDGQTAMHILRDITPAK